MRRHWERVESGPADVERDGHELRRLDEPGLAVRHVQGRHHRLPDEPLPQPIQPLQRPERPRRHQRLPVHRRRQSLQPRSHVQPAEPVRPDLSAVVRHLRHQRLSLLLRAESRRLNGPTANANYAVTIPAGKIFT